MDCRLPKSVVQLQFRAKLAVLAEIPAEAEDPSCEGQCGLAMSGCFKAGRRIVGMIQVSPEGRGQESGAAEIGRRRPISCPDDILQDGEFQVRVGAFATLRRRRGPLALPTSRHPVARKQVPASAGST